MNERTKKKRRGIIIIIKKNHATEKVAAAHGLDEQYKKRVGRGLWCCYMNCCRRCCCCYFCLFLTWRLTIHQPCTNFHPSLLSSLYETTNRGLNLPVLLRNVAKPFPWFRCALVLLFSFQLKKKKLFIYYWNELK